MEFGTKHPQTFETLYQPVIVLSGQGNIEHPSKYFALPEFGTVSHRNTLRALYWFGIALSDQRFANWAERLHEMVLTSTRSMLGREHPNTLNSMNSLTIAYKRKSQWKKGGKL